VSAAENRGRARAALALAIGATIAGCALDLGGDLFPPARDEGHDVAGDDGVVVVVDGDDGAIPEASEEPPDDPPVDPDATEDPAVEEAFACTPGEPCDGSGTCCRNAAATFECRMDTEGCLCGGVDDRTSCGPGKRCCLSTDGGTPVCGADSEGCLCNPVAPDIADFCGEGRICCNKGDFPRCFADTSSCACTMTGDDLIECGTTNRHCCDRGDGVQRCGPNIIGCNCITSTECGLLTCCNLDDRTQCVSDTEWCRCENVSQCGPGKVCCDLDKFDDLDNDKECHGSAYCCHCADITAYNCDIFDEGLECQTLGYCDRSGFCILE
jgi:hypothetical protein